MNVNERSQNFEKYFLKEKIQKVNKFSLNSSLKYVYERL
jgi:hypothetical protein